MTDVNDTARDSADPLISVTGLSVSYDVARTGKKADSHRERRLDVFEGEFITVLGPSGCGKTTFMNVIAGPRRAEHRLGPRRRQGGARPGARPAVVFQDYALLPWRTVFDNVKFGLEMQKGLRTADWRAKVQEAIDMVGPQGVRVVVSPRALRRHAAARGSRPARSSRSPHPADGRAARRRRRPHP